MFGVHKALGQRHRVLPGVLPVRTQTRQHQLHEPTDQIGITTVGQDKESRVVDHQSQPLAPLRFGPANRFIPRFEVQGRRAPGRYGQPLAFPNDRVAQPFAHQLGAMEVMLLDENLIAFPDVLRANQQPGGHARQDGLLVSRRPTKAEFGFLHCRKSKKLFPNCSAKCAKPLNWQIVSREDRRVLIAEEHKTSPRGQNRLQGYRTVRKRPAYAILEPLPPLSELPDRMRPGLQRDAGNCGRDTRPVCP